MRNGGSCATRHDPPCSGARLSRGRVCALAQRAREPAWYKGFMNTPEVDRLADEIAELSAHIDAATHRFLTLIARFDEIEGWGEHGARTCAHWLSWRVGLDLGAAREHVRVARSLRELPLIDDALRRGRISYSKVRALTRVATAENEAHLLDMARASTASQLERICRGYRLAVRNATPVTWADEDEERWVHERLTDTGHVRFTIQLHPEEAAALRRAIEAATFERNVSAGTRQAPMRRADAIVAVAERFLTTTEPRESGPPVEIVVHVEAGNDPDAEIGATLDDGTAVSRTTTDRLMCDAAVVEVGEDAGTIHQATRRRRTIPTLLRRALHRRDRGCRFPGCTNRYVDGHHVVPWSRGGPTTLANLCSLCRRHHTFVHDRGIRIVPEANGFTFLHAHGAVIEPTRPSLGPSPIDALLARIRSGGVVIDASTNACGWDGKPADYDHTDVVLMARHRRDAERTDGLAD